MTTDAPDTAGRLRSRLRLDNVLRAGVILSLAATLGLALLARANDYALRVTSDSPTFLSLIPKMAAHPFQPVSPYLAEGSVQSAHATPYMQLLAFVWRSITPDSRLATDPVGLSRMLAIAGILVFGFLLFSVFWFVSAHATRRAAWLSLPVVLLLFGPANVLWASDMSFHGALYGGYFPQNLALALALCSLVVLERGSRRSLAAAVVLVGLTMLVHPFTGVLLCALATAQASWHAVRGDRRFLRAPVALAGGFALGLAWPAYSLSGAFSANGVPAVPLMAVCALVPFALVALHPPLERLGSSLARTARVFERSWAEIVLAAVGGCLALGLVAWEYLLLDGPTDNPLTQNRHLAVYWVEDRWRWPLMYAAGAVGIAGVVRLARRRRPLPLAWAAGCFLAGLVGLAGAPIPVWWRFLLLAQVPLAIGVVVVLTETRSRAVRILVTATFALCLVVKLYTLFGVTTRDTYYGAKLQPVWAVGTVIPAGKGAIASDPFTSYYLPAITGRPVLTVTKAHVGSPSELHASERGYETLQRFAVWDSYPGWDWWQGARALWESGVRWVVVEHSTSLRPTTLEQFSTGPTPLVRTDRDRRLLGRYMWRLNRIGTLKHDDGTYAVWHLNGAVIKGLEPPLGGGAGVNAGALSHAR